MRFSLWLLTHTVYRIRIVGQENVPFRGPALLVCNHLSQVDGMLVGSCVQRFIRFLVYRRYYEHWALHPLLKLMKAIPISAGREALASLEQARRELQDGHVVCIFAEGSISRTGNMLPFKRGFERIVDGLDVPIVPVYLDRVWGSIFSFKGGRFFWKWPVRVPYPVTVAFGRPLPSTTSAAEARLALQTLGCDLAMQRRPADESLARQFVRTAKHRWWSFSMADATTKPLTFGRVLVAAMLLSRWARRRLPNESSVGLLLPASVGGALANLGLSLAGKVPVNLNFTAGRESMVIAIEQCEIKTIVTSRRFLSKAGIEPFDGMVFLEDVMKEFSARREAPHVAHRIPVAGLGDQSDLPGTARRRHPGGGDFLERKHRGSQRRHAHEPQHPRQRRLDRPGVSAGAGGCARRRPPLLSFVRIHRDHLAAGTQRIRCGLPSQPDGRENDRRAGRPLPCHGHHQHAHVLLVVHPQV